MSLDELLLVEVEVTNIDDRVVVAGDPKQLQADAALSSQPGAKGTAVGSKTGTN